MSAAPQSEPPGASMAASELLPVLYEELRTLPAHKLANEARGQTLQTAYTRAWLCKELKREQ